MSEHVWDGTTGYTLTHELEGKGKGSSKGIKGTMTLDGLTGLFTDAMSSANGGFEVMDIRVSRSLRTHQDGLTGARSSITALGICSVKKSTGTIKLWNPKSKKINQKYFKTRNFRTRSLETRFWKRNDHNFWETSCFKLTV